MTDTALSATLVKSAGLILEAADALVSVLKRRAYELAEVPTVGRTHGMHAEPTTFGTKLALACLQADRDRTRLRRAQEAVRVGKLSGAVGTYSNIDPFVERHVCEALCLRPVPATQVIARDRHAEYLYACAALGTTIEAIATEIRHLQRTEVAEVDEPSLMARRDHRRRLTSEIRSSRSARAVFPRPAGYLVSGLEDVALWHERDISHSSVERIVLPDASMVAYYCAKTMTKVIDGLVVNVDRMVPTCSRHRTASCSPSPCCWHWSGRERRGRPRTASCNETPVSPTRKAGLFAKAGAGSGGLSRSRWSGRGGCCARGGFRPHPVTGTRAGHLCGSREPERVIAHLKAMAPPVPLRNGGSSGSRPFPDSACHAGLAPGGVIDPLA